MEISMVTEQKHSTLVLPNNKYQRKWNKRFSDIQMYNVIRSKNKTFLYYSYVVDDMDISTNTWEFPRIPSYVENLTNQIVNL